jgi:nitrogen fixation/metabolism regulation signal transduction histidine kinase
MLLDRFFYNILIRVLLIVLTSLLLGLVLQHLDKGYYFTLAGIVFLILIQVYMLVNQVNRTNSDLEKFFSSVQDHDTSFMFAENEGSNSFRKLYVRMNQVNGIIQDARMESERAGHFLQSVIDHIETGLLSVDKKGRTGICNRAARRYVNIHKSCHISSPGNGDDEISVILKAIRPGQEILYRKKTGDLRQSILIKASDLKYETNKIMLVSFQDITNELNKKELDSWQKLVRVLTHEIMNSISPITSLASVISGYYRSKEGGKIIRQEAVDHQIVSRTLSGLDTIEETGKGLLDFVDKFRSLTSLPLPRLSRFPVESLFSKCKLLLESNIPDGIKINASVFPEDLSITADYAQTELILINLIKNAVEALSGREDGSVRLSAFRETDSVVIRVEDNGPGIPDEMLEDIFVPFYTTKSGGTGIGLSLSKQIMQNHGGNIAVSSVEGKGSKFSLKFP